MNYKNILSVEPEVLDGALLVAREKATNVGMAATGVVFGIAMYEGVLSQVNNVPMNTVGAVAITACAILGTGTHVNAVHLDRHS